MISTYQDVISLFGEKDEEAEVLALNFSIKHPDFTWHDLLKCIELIIENFHASKADNTMYGVCLHSRQIGANGWTSMISQMMVKIETQTAWHSEIILRNIFRLMFETSIWDQDIIMNTDFIDSFSKICDKLDHDAKDYAHKTSRSLLVSNENDLINARESIFELKDKLFSKI